MDAHCQHPRNGKQPNLPHPRHIPNLTFSTIVPLDSPSSRRRSVIWVDDDSNENEDEVEQDDGDEPKPNKRRKTPNIQSYSSTSSNLQPSPSIPHTPRRSDGAPANFGSQNNRVIDLTDDAPLPNPPNMTPTRGRNGNGGSGFGRASGVSRANNSMAYPRRNPTALATQAASLRLGERRRSNANMSPQRSTPITGTQASALLSGEYFSRGRTPSTSGGPRSVVNSNAIAHVNLTHDDESFASAQRPRAAPSVSHGHSTEIIMNDSSPAASIQPTRLTPRAQPASSLRESSTFYSAMLLSLPFRRRRQPNLQGQCTILSSPCARAPPGPGAQAQQTEFPQAQASQMQSPYVQLPLAPSPQIQTFQGQLGQVHTSQLQRPQSQLLPSLVTGTHLPRAPLLQAPLPQAEASRAVQFSSTKRGAPDSKNDRSSKVLKRKATSCKDEQPGQEPNFDSDSDSDSGFVDYDPAGNSSRFQKGNKGNGAESARQNGTQNGTRPSAGTNAHNQDSSSSRTQDTVEAAQTRVHQNDNALILGIYDSLRQHSYVATVGPTVGIPIKNGLNGASDSEYVSAFQELQKQHYHNAELENDNAVVEREKLAEDLEGFRKRIADNDVYDDGEEELASHAQSSPVGHSQGVSACQRGTKRARRASEPKARQLVAGFKRPKIQGLKPSKPSSIISLRIPSNLPARLKRFVEGPKDPAKPIGDKCFLLHSVPRCESIGHIKVPVEVYQRIYSILLVANKPIEVLHGWSQVYRRQQNNPDMHPAILRTCRQIYDEAINVLYGANTFSYPLRDDGRMVEFGEGNSWGLKMPLRKHISRLRHLELVLETSGNELKYGLAISRSIRILNDTGVNKLHKLTIQVIPHLDTGNNVSMATYFHPIYPILSDLMDLKTDLIQVNVHLPMTNSESARSIRTIVDKTVDLDELAIFRQMDQQVGQERALDKNERRRRAESALVIKANENGKKQLNRLSSRIENACTKGAAWVVHRGWFEEFVSDFKRRDHFMDMAPKDDTRDGDWEA